mgnify:FL=1
MEIPMLAAKLTILKNKQTMIIKKIRTNADGFKGAAVEFYQEEEKNGKPVLVLHKVYPKNPIHLGLEKLFKDLRPHLLAVAGIVYDKTNLNDMVTSETSIDTVKMENGTIEIGGFKQVLEDKYMRLDTPKLQDTDEYEGFDDLNAIVTRIAEETVEYIKGNVKVDALEVSLRYVQAGKAKGVSMDDITAMSVEEQRDWATRFLENNFGSTVLHNEDLDMSEIDTSESFEEVSMSLEDSKEEDNF